MVLLILLLNFFTDHSKIEVSVNGITEAKGQLCIAIYDSEQNFMKEAQVALLKTVEVTCTGHLSFFLELPPGTYAITLFHDLNGDNALNKTMIGLPREPYGFSNNPKIYFGPPSFDETRFEVAKEISLKIELR